MGIRKATSNDVPRMLELAAVKRSEYEAYSPVFWRPAANAKESQRAFFEKLVDDAGWICLVQDADGLVDGFVMARVVPAPPVYDPGGKACVIDDFAVSSPSLWATVGAELRDAAERHAAQAGAVVSVTVCGHRDTAKRKALLDSGSHVASEWHVRSIQQNDSRSPAQD
jgi:GNAT superfamily N-acetyltransferase